jgi:hypothetical protein
MSFNGISLKQGFGAVKCQSSPLVEEALRLGFIVQSVIGSSSSPLIELPLALRDYQGVSHRVRLPCGHRFYVDCLREQEARLISWLIHTFEGDGWFFTLTFKDWISVNRAWAFHDRFLARLNQAYLEVSGAELLRSITSVEWQQRDVIHFHLLIVGRQLRALSRKRWERRWQLTSGGFCANYKAEIKAAPYLAKHAIKDRLESNLYFGGSWRGIVPPRSVSRCCSKSVAEGAIPSDSAHFKWHDSVNLGSLPMMPGLGNSEK